MQTNFFLRKAKRKDKEDVLQLSNLDYVRKYSINKEKIKWKDHDKWFDDILQSKSNLFYIVTDSFDNFFGQIRYKIEEEYATVSISLHPSILGKGLSKPTIEESINLLIQERKNVRYIIAFISEENIVSKKLFKKVGFIENRNKENLLELYYDIKLR